MTLSAREQIERPWFDDNQDSIRRRGIRPHDLLRWFLDGFRAEIPDHATANGVWADHKGRGDNRDYEPVGGSLIGSPRLADAFRAYMEDDPRDATEDARLTDDGTTTADQAYRFPMRTALRELAGQGPDTAPYPFMARMLFRTACMDGDWDAACRSLGIPEPVRRPYVYGALDRLYERYRDEPPARPIRRNASVA